MRRGLIARRPWLGSAYATVGQFVDPLRLASALRNTPRYLSDRATFRRLSGPGDATFEHRPELHDRTSTTPVDPHYLFTNGWAARRINATAPRLHVDVGSQVAFVSQLSATVAVGFVDFRPLRLRLSGLLPLTGDIVNLPFAAGSVRSLSSLHVAEHIGLGRYGDPIDPAGTRRACAELARVLAPGGDLFFAVPVGGERVCFNSHRVLAPTTVAEYFAALELAEFCRVDDEGHYHEAVPLSAAMYDSYGCGLFWFRK